MEHCSRILLIFLVTTMSCAIAMCEAKNTYEPIINATEYIARPYYGYSNNIKNTSIELLLTLITKEGSEELILDLFEAATNEGKLYFLSALYYVSQRTFESKVKSLSSDDRIVEIVEGDQRFTKSIKSLMIHEGAINIPRGKFVDEIIQNDDQISLDFLGGGYPVMLFDSAFDLGMFLKADDLTSSERRTTKSTYSERRRSLRKTLFGINRERNL